jgi:hypothetical protein
MIRGCCYLADREEIMGSRARVKQWTDRAINVRATDEKLNAIAQAIYELADFVDDLENKLRALEQRSR